QQRLDYSRKIAGHASRLGDQVLVERQVHWALRGADLVRGFHGCGLLCAWYAHREGSARRAAAARGTGRLERPCERNRPEARRVGRAEVGELLDQRRWRFRFGADLSVDLPARFARELQQAFEIHRTVEARDLADRLIGTAAFRERHRVAAERHALALRIK